MCSYGKLPGDYAIDALSLEAKRRGRLMGDPHYSYGQLVADTTEEERERIADSYRAECRRKRGRGCTHSFFEKADKEGAGN